MNNQNSLDKKSLLVSKLLGEIDNKISDNEVKDFILLSSSQTSQNQAMFHLHEKLFHLYNIETLTKQQKEVPSHCNEIIIPQEIQKGCETNFQEVKNSAQIQIEKESFLREAIFHLNKGLFYLDSIGTLTRQQKEVLSHYNERIIPQEIQKEKGLEHANSQLQQLEFLKKSSQNPSFPGSLQNPPFPGSLRNPPFLGKFAESKKTSSNDLNIKQPREITIARESVFFIEYPLNNTVNFEKKL